ncbi:microcephalin isoform X2 [Syngnathus acus]|uniref:microcephalin isoform X2 n=1 Tax=Syngnathus acus TaxID=161584 RepID=UPI001885C69E|nr:microcephalin isoform X2 [Syngnathus acus]
MPVMTTSINDTVLKDVVAFVDVWSSDKRANCSKPFIQQLQEMGAQVSKTFNKQVTHVVFNNGHAATWKKAKKSHVKLVSVLWIGRCHDDGVLVDEKLYPALNDESNLVLWNKKHRCMLPRDCPVRTTENDRRMKKKLDKLMKDIIPKKTMVPDDSPIIIDEDSGTLYSPSFKRAEYMAERLKRMKEQHENISPTASQMSSSSQVEPPLGNSPTVSRFFCENSDEDSSASVAELGYSPNKSQVCNTMEQNKLDKPFSKDLEKPWLSPCRDILERPSISPLKMVELTLDEEEGKTAGMQRTASVTESPIQKSKSEEGETPEKQRTASVTQPPIEKPKLAGVVSCNRKRRSQMPSCSSLDKMKEPTIDRSDEGRSNIHWAEVKNKKIPHVVDSVGHIRGDTLFNDQSKLSSKPTQGRRSLSALAHSFSSSSKSHDLALNSPDGEDDVFDDFFSSATHHKKFFLPVLPDLTDINIYSELNYVPKKGKQRSWKSAATETKSSKKRKVASIEHRCRPQSVVNVCPQNNVKENLPAFDHSSGTQTLASKRPTETMSTLELEKNSHLCHLSDGFQRGGSESTAPAASTDENQEKPNKHACSFFQNISKAKAARTLVMTSMPTEKQNIVAQVVETLGGFSIADRVCQSTTHVISGEHRRTLNVLLGIARGCWILSFEWILTCLEQRQWIPEEPYELSELYPAAQICRLQRRLSSGDHHQQDLFQDQPPMFVSQHSQPPAPSMVELIQLCGGTICKTVRQAGICIGRYNGRRPVGCRILSEQWVLDSITHLKQLSYDNYDLA